MSKYVKSHDLDTTWSIDESDQTWTLGKNATISVTDAAAVWITAGNTGNTIRLKGDLEVGGTKQTGVMVEGDDTTLRIAKSSFINANVGIDSDVTSCVVRNAGTIESSLFGMIFEGGFDLTNSGRISGNVGVYSEQGSDIANLEGGVIDGGDYGLQLTGMEANHIVNDGLIRADNVAITTSGENDTLINRGRIVGNVYLDDGEDMIDTRSGKIKGNVDAGDGNDIYMFGKSHIQLAEKFDLGWDEVHSTKSFKLAANFEELLLLGKKSIDGTGNGDLNYIKGNDGDNVMHGKGGNDHVSGGAGRDELFGDGGADDFVYYNGDGRDVVMDFDITQDQIALMSFGMDSADEVAPLLSQHGNDTWISFGSGDRLVLKDVVMEDLTPEMFIFDYASVAVV